MPFKKGKPLDLGNETGVKPEASLLLENPLHPKDQDTLRRFLNGKKTN